LKYLQILNIKRIPDAYIQVGTKKNYYMFKFFIKIYVLVAFVVLLISSCSKDNDDSGLNSTNGKTTAVFNSNVTYGKMTDQDGNVYKTVTIGSQTWMAENLRTTKYNDGTSIPNVTFAIEWRVLTTGAYCNYINTTSNDSIATYGRLYNWYAVNTGKLAPKGWHVPTNDEWITLTTYIGGTSVAGGKLKEIGTTHWISPNTGATNETGFTALPGSYCYYNGTFGSFGDFGNWWSANEDNSQYAWGYYMDCNRCSIVSFNFNKEDGFSIRCVKD
jgi:uncharacterized protein (TIGR02145 family)